MECAIFKQSNVNHIFRKNSEAPVIFGLKYAHLLGEHIKVVIERLYLKPFPMGYKVPLFLFLDSENRTEKRVLHA